MKVMSVTTPIKTGGIDKMPVCDLCRKEAIVELVNHPELSRDDWDYESILLCEEHARKMVKDVEAIYK